MLYTVYPKKYAHGFEVLCFLVVMQSFIMNSHEVFIHIHQGCFAGTGAIVRLPQCQWSKPDGYGKISQCITTTKHSKAKTVCIFLGIYCISHNSPYKRYTTALKWKLHSSKGREIRDSRLYVLTVRAIVVALFLCCGRISTECFQCRSPAKLRNGLKSHCKISCVCNVLTRRVHWP